MSMLSQSFTAGSNSTSHSIGNDGVGRRHREKENGSYGSSTRVGGSKRAARVAKEKKEKKRLTRSFSSAPKAYYISQSRKSKMAKKMLRDPALR